MKLFINERFSAVLLLASLAIAHPCSAQVSETEAGCDVARIDGINGCPTIGVERPFQTQESIERFRDYLNHYQVRVPDNFFDGLPNLEYWGYEFSSAGGGSDYSVSFRANYDIEGLFSSLRTSLSAIRKDGCSYFRTENPSVSIVGPLHVRARGQIEGKVRSCGNYPWPASGQWKVNVGNIGGQATIDIYLSAELTAIPDDKYNGRVTSQDPIVNIDAEAEQILGFDSNSLAGQVLYFIGENTLDLFSFVRNPSSERFQNAINLLDKGALRFNQSITLSASAVTAYDGNMNSRQYNLFLSDVQTNSWPNSQRFFLDTSRSGFYSIESINQFSTIYLARIPKFVPVQRVYEDAEREIELIRGFSKPKVEYIVRPGDTLWRISDRNYGSGFYHNLVAGYNKIPVGKRDRLRVGQPIQLPQLYEFEVLDSVHFVRPGDSLNRLCARWRPDNAIGCRSEVVKANRGVNFKRLRVLEPIFMPIFTN